MFVIAEIIPKVIGNIAIRYAISLRISALCTVSVAFNMAT